MTDTVKWKIEGEIDLLGLAIELVEDQNPCLEEEDDPKNISIPSDQYVEEWIKSAIVNEMLNGDDVVYTLSVPEIHDAVQSIQAKIKEILREAKQTIVERLQSEADELENKAKQLRTKAQKAKRT